VILRATELAEVLRGLTLGFIVKSILSAAWLGFSLTYSRGDYRESRSAAHRYSARFPAPAS
jgi:hypothetical protein